MNPDLSVMLLHDQMVNKAGELVTTSITLIDIHDIARSARTYGVTSLYVAHPSPRLRHLAQTVQIHWQQGFGAAYNPNRKEALELVDIVYDLDEAIHKIALRSGKTPTLVATSARAGGRRIGFQELREKIHDEAAPFALMLGTGWGMSETLLKRAHLFLEPVQAPSDYNHLSVRSACAIMLDRLLASAPSKKSFHLDKLS